MVVVTGGDHAEGEHDAGGTADVEAQLPSKEICHGAEDEGAENETHDGQCVQVGHHHCLTVKCFRKKLPRIVNSEFLPYHRPSRSQ